MATFNRAQFIVESLQSIINQTYMLWECLIIDDGGTDNTEQVISEILKRENRIKFLKRPDTYKKGIPGCRNYGIDNANGNYVIFFDDDDIIHPQNLQLCLEAFQKEKIDFCVYEKQAFFKTINSISFSKEIIDIKRPISSQDLDKVIMNKISIASCTVLWKKECFNNERFDESLLYAEEWECYPRVIGNDKKGLMLNNILYFNRKHSNSNTGEFYDNDSIRVASKMKAIRLLIENLYNRNLLSKVILKYLSGLAISYRDKGLLNNILIITKAKPMVKLFLNFKYNMFPVWKTYKKNLKKVNKNYNNSRSTPLFY
jgi:glycosyltransferase involved in cell wall biosynthesis